MEEIGQFEKLFVWANLLAEKPRDLQLKMSLVCWPTKNTLMQSKLTWMLH